MLANLLIVGFDGYEMSTDLKAIMNSSELGGVILFKRNIKDAKQVTKLNKEILNFNKTNPPLISVDQEGGRVARLKDITTNLPAMGEIKSEQDAYLVGETLGMELRALGFNLDFAPVCDVVVNKDNQVIGDRSFSDNALIVAKLASQIILGLQNNQVAACAKHFPGHGDTSIDSHFFLPTVTTPKEVILERDLEPFRMAIKNNVDTIMTAHILAKNLDSYWPATMSYEILVNILRKQLGFNGVIISDDLEMKAIFDNYDLETIIEKSLKASVNMFIVSQDLKLANKILDILENFYTNNEELRILITESINKVNILKNKYKIIL
jgi:beta-N-acetylhexosaminidase